MLYKGFRGLGGFGVFQGGLEVCFIGGQEGMVFEGWVWKGLPVF